MNTTFQAESKVEKPKPTNSATPANLIQRKCACGNNSGLTGECEECSSKRLIGNHSSAMPTKLKIGDPNDKYEKEADKVADAIMKMPDPVKKPALTREMQKKGLILRKLSTQKLSSSNEYESGYAPPIVHDVLNSSGQPLDPETREFFESRLGYDLGQVRIHTNNRAATSANEINAKAYTLDSNIIFNKGAYNSENIEGQKLLAHELTHVIQQNNSVTNFTRGTIQRQSKEKSLPNNNSRSSAMQYVDDAKKSNVIQRIKQARIRARKSKSRIGRIRGIYAVVYLIIKRFLPRFLSMVNGVGYVSNVNGVQIDKFSSGGFFIRVGDDFVHSSFKEQIKLLRKRVVRAISIEYRGADELISEHKDIRQLRVITNYQNQTQLEESFDTDTKNSLPENTKIKFAKNVPPRLRFGLENIAGALTTGQGKTLTINTTITLALDLEKYGFGYDTYRFTMLDVDDSRKEILIERQRSMGKESLGFAHRKRMLARFSHLNLNFPHLDLDDETRDKVVIDETRDKVLIALSMVPMNLLNELKGLTFELKKIHAKDPDVLGKYNETNNTITLYDKAFSKSAFRFGNSFHPLTQTIFTILHEIGHGVSDRTIPRSSKKKFNDAVEKDGGRELMPTDYPIKADTDFVEEFFAESFVLFLTSPKFLQRIRPNIFKFMQEEFKK